MRLACAAALLMFVPPAAPAGAQQPAAGPDPAAAAREYRLARRLAAEGSPQAAPALERVLELDPTGALADDALVELALLEGIARWPEQLGRLSAASADRAHRRLNEVLERLPGSDRADDAALLRALLDLEPLPGQDPAAARVRLLALATLHPDPEFAGRARQAVGWIDERAPRLERARSAYQRLVIDHPGIAVAAKARVGLGRVALLEGRYASSATHLEAALELGAAAGMRPDELRELAVRSALRVAGTAGRWMQASPARADIQLRGSDGFARTARDGIVVADRRQELLRFIDGGSGRWTDRRVEGLQSLAVDGFGRVLAVTVDGVLAVGDERATRVGGLGEFAPAKAVAADGLGRVWVADRRGGRVGLLTPGAATPSPLWESDVRRIEQLAWDGRRMLALDGRNDQLLELDPDGGDRPLEGAPPFDKPAWIACSFGQTAVLDLRLQSVVLLGPDGVVLERFDYRTAGIDRPVALALGPDGGLDVLESDGIWTRLP